MTPHCLTITHPWDGDILNRHDGVETNDALTIEVSGAVPAGATVTVNGALAVVEGESFSATVRLERQRNSVTAVGRLGDAVWMDDITVLWDKASRPRYRFSIDDNIEFLRDLGTRPQDYPSLFDHWYLAFWRRMHEQFGAKIHINIYYQSVGGDFTLAQLSSRWRDEWQASADWLHLSFHALQDQPERVYRGAGYDRVARDYDLVMDEILRFAGPEVVSDVTTLHWAEGSREVCQALHDRGIRTLIALFDRHSDGQCTTGYYLRESLKDHGMARDAWYDPSSDLTFITCDEVVNSYALDAVVPRLERQAASPHTSELMELLIHEQYFRKELPIYQADVQEKVVRALQWVTERGYEPVFWGDGFLGNETQAP